jgi:mono/diheme cytochrome c family protein
MKNTTKFLAFSIFLFLVISCGNKNEKSPVKSNLPELRETTVSAISSEAMDRGIKVYKAHCFACHQNTGIGIKGVFPPLVENKTVMGDKSKLIGIILNGMSGEIEVKGEKYNRVMAPHDFLTDSQIADVLTYIRNSFGNQAEMVKTEEVTSLRNK